MHSVKLGAICATIGASILGVSSHQAVAGGFEVKEQSTHYQGMSFAGSAAGGTLSSMFWNPAAATAAPRTGIALESGYALILPESEITGTATNSTPIVGPLIAGALNAKDNSVDIGQDVIVPSSYAAMRMDVDPKAVFGLAINSQFGLGTKPDNPDWTGDQVSRSAKIFSININPTVSYDIMPGVTVGGGIMVQYLELKSLKTSADLSAVPLPGLGATAGAQGNLSGDDIEVGFTAGLLLKPAAGTSIGIGYRSSLEHDVTGQSTLTLGGVDFAVPVTADITLPDKVTLSFEQALSPSFRALGTVEWTNWSKLDIVPVEAAATTTLPTGTTFSPGDAVAVIDAQWHDGWFFSLGGEYDYSDKITIRAGAAYEISPMQNASERLLQAPDSDRVWLSAGGTYKWSDNMSIDFAYSHIFVEDSKTVRSPLSTNPAFAATTFTGDVESSVDIISVGLKTRW